MPVQMHVHDQRHFGSQVFFGPRDQSNTHKYKSVSHDDLIQIEEAFDREIWSEGKALDISSLGNASKHKGRPQAKFEAGDLVGVHTVADHDRIGSLRA
jgi:hypothetical protein